MNMSKYECIVCGLIYDEKEGWPDDGIAPGTRWADVPEDWLCPDCGVGKEDFELLEEAPVDDTPHHEEPVVDKVHLHDLHATILHLMGFNHEQLTYRHAGRDYRLTDVHGNVVHDVLA